MNNRSEYAIRRKIFLYLQLLSDKVNQLNATEIAKYPVLKNLPKDFLKKLEYFEALKLEGFCNGSSISRAAMRITGKLKWWDDAIDHLLQWDENFESLNNEYHLIDSENNNLTPLYVIFERITNNLVYNQGHVFDILQHEMLKPGGPFLVLNHLNQPLVIQHHYGMAGSFTGEKLITLLENEEISKAVSSNICLVHNYNHTCELGYHNSQWHFFDPAYIDGEAKSFDSLQTLIAEIITRLGENLYIELACVEDIANNPFSSYEELLKNPIEIKNLLFGGDGKGVHMIAKNMPYLLPQLLKDIESSEIIEILNKQSKKGFTPLINATIQQEPDAILTLINLGSNVNHANNQGQTSLMYAIGNDDIKSASILLSHGANPNLRNIDGTTALSHAVYHSNLESAHLLLSQGADPNIKDNLGWTPLMMATQKNDLDCINILVNAGANPNVVNESGFTPLLFAITNNDTSSVKALLKANANTNFGCTSSQYEKDYSPIQVCQHSPLFLAAKLGLVTIVDLLLSHAANFNYTEPMQISSLINYASQFNRQEEVKALFNNEIEKGHTHLIGFTALHVAVFFGHTDVVNQLLSAMKQANCLKPDVLHEVILLATAMNHVEILTMLNIPYQNIPKTNAILTSSLSQFENRKFMIPIWQSDPNENKIDDRPDGKTRERAEKRKNSDNGNIEAFKRHKK